MRRSKDILNLPRVASDDNGPNAKVRLVEMDPKPSNVALVNPQKVTKRTCVEAMELCESLSNTDTVTQAVCANKLDVLGRQMKELEDQMHRVLAETQHDVDLHKAACNFVKKPGHIYHLYERPSGQLYFGMLSPEEWSSPHRHLGSYRLEVDQSWTDISREQDKYAGLNYIKEVLYARTLQLN